MRHLSVFALLPLWLLTFSLSAQTVDLDAGLVAHYPMNGTGEDASGNANHCAIEGDVIATVDRFNRPGNALLLDGNRDYLVANSSESLRSPKTAISLTVWTNVRALDGPWAVFLDKSGSTAAASREYSLIYREGGRFYGPDVRNSGAACGSLLTETELTLNEWHFLAVTWENSLARYYLDGRLLGELATCEDTLGTGDGALYIGLDRPGVSEYLDGAIDEVRIYDRALNEAELDALFTESPNETDLGILPTGEELHITDEGRNSLEILVQNQGRTPITTADIEVRVDAGTARFSVPLNLAPRDTQTLILAGLPFRTERVHQVRAEIVRVNGAVDGNAANDVGEAARVLVNPARRHEAIRFQGQSYVSAVDCFEPEIGPAMTMEAWAFPTGRGSNFQQGGMLINKEFEFEMARFPDGVLHVAFGDGLDWTNRFWLSTGYVVPLFQWTHVAAVFDRGWVRAYANGNLIFEEQQAFETIGAAGVFPDSDIRIGGRKFQRSQHFDGYLDEVRLWKVARTPDELIDWMPRTSGVEDEPGLVAAWHFGEGEGDRAFSSTGQFHARLFDGAEWIESTAPVPDNRFRLDAGIVDIHVERDGEAWVAYAVLRNFGEEDLRTVNVNWSVGGQPRPATEWAGFLPAQSMDTVLLGTYTFPDGLAFEITAATSDPNGAVDFMPRNDAYRLKGFRTPLRGTYSVGGSAAQFADPVAAAEALMAVGIAGDVTFEIAAGTYSGQLDIGEFSGGGCDRTVRFQPDPALPGPVVLTASADGSLPFLLQLDGADGLVFSGLNFDLAGTRAETVVQIQNGSACNTFSGCVIRGQEVTGRTERFLVFSPLRTAVTSDNHFVDNRFEGAGIGIGVFGANRGYEVTGNRFTGQSWEGIEFMTADSLRITGNVIRSAGGENTDFTGILLEDDSPNSLVTRNRIYASAGRGLWLLDQRDSILVSNNYLEVGGVREAFGLRLDNSPLARVYHNTVNVTSTDTTGSAALLLGTRMTDTFEVVNNIFANGGGGYAVRSLTALPLTGRMDHNALFTTGNFLALADTRLSGLAEWQAASGADANSVEADPLLIADTLGYRVAQIRLEGRGTPLPDVPEDIGGQPRNPSAPDIGAYEFTLQPNDVGVASVDYPGDACALTAVERIRVTVRNYGTIAQGGFPIAYVLDGRAPVVEVIDATIAPGERYVHEFSGIDLSLLGERTLSVYTLLPGDEAPTNDSVADYRFTNYVAVSAPTDLTPATGAEGLDLPVTFTWSPSGNVEGYDLYLWPEGGGRPAVPTAANITRIRYTYYEELVFGATYAWQVVARNRCSEAESEIQLFRLRDLPDLAVGDVAVTGTDGLLLSGRPMTVAFTVANVGLDGTRDGDWYEYFYLSRDSLRGNADDRYVGGRPGEGPIPAGESQSREYTFNLPALALGDYRVWVELRSNRLREATTENNRGVSATFSVDPAPHPDLVVADVPLPFPGFRTVSGEDLNVAWTLRNQGTQATPPQTWTDRVYLSREEVFDRRTAIFLGDHRHDPLRLAVDSDTTIRASFQIPVQVFGDFRVFVETDVRNRVFEHLQTDNNLSEPGDTFRIDRRPPADLVVDTVAVPPFAANGQEIDISWRVTNQGANPTWSERWSDVVYISRLDTFNAAQAGILGRFARAERLGRDSSYVRSERVRVPRVGAGAYYVYVFTDARREEFEFGNEDNNVTRAEEPITITTPDLTVDGLTTAASLGAGGRYTLRYEHRNPGSGALLAGRWTDRLRLMADPNNPGRDAFTLNSESFATPRLSAGAGEAASLQFTLPDGISGTYFLVLDTDVFSTVFESNENNNRATLRVEITAGEYADLTIDGLTAPESARAGESFELEYTLANEGVGSTGVADWRDRVFLSRSPFQLGTAAIQLSAVPGANPLEPGETRTVAVTAELPADLRAGLYYLVVVTNATGSVYELPQDRRNNESRRELTVTAARPFDLAVTDFTVSTATIRAGQSIDFSYTVTNRGPSAPRAGSWLDGLFLSRDTVWDAGDRLLRQVPRLGSLPAGEAYTVEATARMPYGLSGTFYLLAVTDHPRQLRDVDYANNYLYFGSDTSGSDGSGPLTVPGTQPPDLVVSRFFAPARRAPGELLEVAYEVTNQDTGTALPGGWADRLVLSPDEVLDQNDILLGRRTRRDSLAGMDSYVDTLRVTVPRDATGNYFLLLKTDATDRVFEDRREGNNTYVATLRIDTVPKSDLISTVTRLPAAAAIGDQATIAWTTTNAGANPVNGTLRELVFLSLDTIRDPSDQLVARRDRALNLAPGASAPDSARVLVTGLEHRPYYAIVLTDARDNVMETDETNNASASAATMMVEVEELPLETLVTAELRETRYYRIVIPEAAAGESLEVTMDSDAADASNLLFLRYEAVPTRAVHDFAVRNPRSADQQLVAPAVRPGTYYLLVRTESGAQNVNLRARILPFELTRVDAGEGGNTGLVTVLLEGGQFETGMGVDLRHPSLPTATAVRVEVTDPTEAYATFNLNGQPIGTYDVVATRSGAEAALPDGFRVVAGTDRGLTFVSEVDGEEQALDKPFSCCDGGVDVGKLLDVRTTHPPTTRPRRIVPITFTATNTGNVDVPAPTRFLVSVEGAPLAFAADALAERRQELCLQFREPNGPVHVLRPGARVSFTVYTQAIAPLRFQLAE